MPTTSTPDTTFLAIDLNQTLIPEDKDPPPLKKSHCLPKLLPAALWILPLINAITDAVYTAEGVLNMENSLFLAEIEVKGNNLVAMVTVIPAIEFIESLLVTGHWTIHGIKQTFCFMQNRHLPENWPDISEKSKWLMGLVGTITFTSAFFIGNSSYYYLNQLTQNNSLCITNSVIEGAINFFSEGLETSRTLLTTTPQAYQYPYITRLLSYPMITIGPFIEILENQLACVEVFSIESNLKKLLSLSLITLTNGTTNFCYYGKLFMYALDELIADLCSVETLVALLKKTSLLALTSIPAFFLCVAEIYFAFEVSEKAEKILPFDISPTENSHLNSFLQTSIFMKAVRDGVILTHALYTDKNIAAAGSYLKSKICRPVNDQRQQVPLQKTLEPDKKPYTNGNTQLFYSLPTSPQPQNTPDPDTTPLPRQSRCHSFWSWFYKTPTVTPNDSPKMSVKNTPE